MPKPKMVRRGLFVLAGFAGLASYACSPSGGTGGSGGGPGSGGVPSVGGGPGAGGVPSVGGGPGAGGAPGLTGGAPGDGGAATGGGAGSGAGGGSTGGGSGTGGDSNMGPATVHLDDQRQLIRGFGINNNWAAIGSAADRLYGDGADSLMLNILRVGMKPSGDAPENGIEPYNGSSCYTDINAVKQRADARSEPHYIMATLWSPPPDCKTNGSIADGGFLLESCYESWSTVVASFADLIEQNTDTTLYAMSPQNETDFASCGRDEPCNGNYDTTVMTGKQAANFQKIVGPKLRAKGVVPMSVEASEWIHVWSNESASGSEPSGLPSSDPLDCGFPANNPDCLTDFGGYDYGHALYADPDAWAAFDIMGTHQYDTQVAEPWPSDVPKGDKEVWQTEMSGVKWWPEQGNITQDAGAPGGWAVTPTTHIANGVAVARWVHSGLVVGEANAWLYWWYQAIDTDDNEGLLTKSGQTAKRYYTFGNFTRYIRPGYHRVGFTGMVPDKVLMSSYTSEDGKVVIVAINETEQEQSIPITIAGGTAPAEMTPIVTSEAANWAVGTAIPVAAGMFTATLPAMSVTTFVSAVD